MGGVAPTDLPAVTPIPTDAPETDVRTPDPIVEGGEADDLAA
jgi:hypothetical protein